MPIAVGELVFNTAMSGYQEVITDPSYAGQVIAFTSTHIGNYGTNAADDEAARVHCRGVVVCDLAEVPSNWRSTEALEPFLVRHGVPALTGVDTRRVARHVRDAGAVPCAFGTASEAELRDGGAGSRRHRRAGPGLGCDRGRAVRQGGERPGRRHRGRLAHRRLRLRGEDDHGRPSSPRWAASPWSRRARRPTTCWRSSPTGCSSPTAPATRPRWPVRPAPWPTWWAGCPSSASAWGTRSWPPRWAVAPTSCPSGTTGPTTRCSASSPAWWRSPARTTTTPWRPTRSPTPTSPTSTSTTA